MEHTERSIERPVSAHEYEQASNSYLMSVIAVMGGLPFPVINFIAAIIFYLGSRKSTYFVRWHCIQSAIGQAVLIPFNSIAFAWTMRMIFSDREFEGGSDSDVAYFIFDGISSGSLFYWLYIFFILLLNLTEFIIVIYTASRVRKGHNVRWAIIAPFTDSLTSKEDRDPYRI